MEKKLNGNTDIDFDFHIHTSPGSKDSKQTVSEMLETANNAGINTVAITDHNQVSSLKEGVLLAQKMGMNFVPGIEMSVYLSGFENDKINLNGEIIHVIGLGITPDEDLYKQLSKDYTKRVNLWMQQIIKATEKHFSYHSTAQDVWQLREELMKKKYFNDRKSVKEWTRTYNDGSIGSLIPFYPDEAINIIHKMGGIAVLAHPNRGERHRRFNQDEVRLIVESLVYSGLDGLEIYHRHVVHEKEIFSLLQTLCHKYNLEKSLGSDRHFAFDYYGLDYFGHREFLENQILKENVNFNEIKNSLLQRINQ